MNRVHVIGASGRSGTAVCRALLARGTGVVPVVRSPARWVATGLSGLPSAGAPLVADLEGEGLAAALSGASHVVSCAHARYAGAIVTAAAADARFVLLGSTRKFTRWPDPHGTGVLTGECAFLSSGRPGVMLHPTMIYGAQGEDNVRRLAALLRRLPMVPLPGGGRALVQPIHQADLTRCILSALDVGWTGPETLVVAGPAAVPYGAFVTAVAQAAGLPPPRLVAVPGALLRLLTPLTRLPGLPRIGADEVRRLLEDKAFDIGPMKATLGIEPISLAEGLARTFGEVAPCP